MGFTGEPDPLSPMVRGMDTLFGGLAGLYLNRNPRERETQPRHGQTEINPSDTGTGFQDPFLPGTLTPRNPDVPQPMMRPVDNLNEYVAIFK